jgi:DNA-3-methyladenine glycosylase II
MTSSGPRGRPAGEATPGVETLRFSYSPRGPYSLAATAARFTRWPEAVDCFDETVYRRLLDVGRTGVLMEVRQAGRRGPLLAELTGVPARLGAAREAADRVLGIGLGAALDIRPFYRAFWDDALLGDALRHSRGLRIAGTPSLWEALVTAVLSQQVNLRFAYDIRRELALAFGRRARFGAVTYYAFPEPSRLARETEETLRRFRLSGAKAATLARLADSFASGRLAQEEIGRLPDEEAIQRLTSVKGVGRWTAEIGLLRGLGRADVFPGADLGVVKYVAMELLGHRARVTEARMRRFADRWRPYRGLALVYAYAEIARRKETQRRTRTPATTAASRRIHPMHARKIVGSRRRIP